MLIVAVCVTTLAIYDANIRSNIYTAAEGTVLMPIHNWIVDSWVAIGTLGFTYIAAAILGLTIGGGLFMVFIVYGLVWQRGLNRYVFHRNQEQQQSTGPMQRDISQDLSGSMSQSPATASPQQKSEPLIEES